MINYTPDKDFLVKKLTFSKVHHNRGKLRKPRRPTKYKCLKNISKVRYAAEHFTVQDDEIEELDELEDSSPRSPNMEQLKFNDNEFFMTETPAIGSHSFNDDVMGTVEDEKKSPILKIKDNFRDRLRKKTTIFVNENPRNEKSALLDSNKRRGSHEKTTFDSKLNIERSFNDKILEKMENNEKNQLFLYDFDEIGYSKKYFPNNNFEEIISKIIKRSEMLN